MKNTIQKSILFVAILAGVFGTTDAFAMSTTWDVTSSGGGVYSGSGFGNTLTYTSDAEKLIVSSYADTGAGAAFETGKVTAWSVGLGTCNQAEGLYCGNPEHQVDNAGQHDWVLFLTNYTTSFDSITIDPYGTWDRDVSYWIGTINPSLDLSGYSYGDLAGLGFGAENQIDNSPSYQAITLALNGDVGNALLIGAQTGDQHCDIDRFKIRDLTTTPSSTVPEPATLMLFGTGLVGLIRSRRKNA